MSGPPYTTLTLTIGTSQEWSVNPFSSEKTLFLKVAGLQGRKVLSNPNIYPVEYILNETIGGEGTTVREKEHVKSGPPK